MLIGKIHGRVEVVLIATSSLNGVIGAPWGLPWPILTENPSFREEVLGSPVIMGRKTYEYLREPIVGSRNIVLTTIRNYRVKGVEVAHSPQEALALVKDAVKCYVVGGSRVFSRMLPYATVVIFTEVDAIVSGHLKFPELHHREWSEVARCRYSAKCNKTFNQSFVVYHRNL